MLGARNSVNPDNVCLVDEGRDDPNATKSGPDDGPALIVGVEALCLQGGPDPHTSPSGSAHASTIPHHKIGAQQTMNQ